MTNNKSVACCVAGKIGNTTSQKCDTVASPRSPGACVERCIGSEAGSHLRLIDFVHHSTIGLRVLKEKKKKA